MRDDGRAVLLRGDASVVAADRDLFKRVWLRAEPPADPSQVVADIGPQGLRCALLAALAKTAFASLREEPLGRVARQLAEEAFDAESRLRAGLARALHELARADPAATDTLRQLRAGPFSAETADVQVDVVATQALSALRDGEDREALELAKTALRMGRAEESPLCELWAHLALARVRRSTGSCHLAAAQLAELRPLWPGALKTWAGHEEDLAGAGSVAAMLADRGAGLAPMWRREIETLASLVDPGWTGSCPSSWQSGAVSEPPLGLFAVAQPKGGEGLAYVWATPERRRRVLAPALRTMDPGAVFHPTERPQLRTFEAAASLLLLEAPVEQTGWFAGLYGFEYEAVRHRNLLDVLVKRIRDLLAGCATLERADGALFIAPKRSLAVWDPRCRRPLEDRVLTLLGQGGPCSAAELASGLGVSKRAIQYVLKELTAGGLAHRRAQNGQVRYVLEDPSISRLTRTRFHWAPFG